MLVNVSAKRRRERLQFRHRQVLQLAVFLHAGLHRVCHHFMRLAKRNSALNKIGGGSQRIHETGFTGFLHPVAIELHQPHEPCGNLHAGCSGCGGIKQRLLRLLHVFVIGKRQALHDGMQRHLAAQQPCALCRGSVPARPDSVSAAWRCCRWRKLPADE